jgi:hypothetical protein
LRRVVEIIKIKIIIVSKREFTIDKKNEYKKYGEGDIKP